MTDRYLSGMSAPGPSGHCKGGASFSLKEVGAKISLSNLIVYRDLLLADEVLSPLFVNLKLRGFNGTPKKITKKNQSLDRNSGQEKIVANKAYTHREDPVTQ